MMPTNSDRIVLMCLSLASVYKGYVSCRKSININYLYMTKVTRQTVTDT